MMTLILALIGITSLIKLISAIAVMRIAEREKIWSH